MSVTFTSRNQLLDADSNSTQEKRKNAKNLSYHTMTAMAIPTRKIVSISMLGFAFLLPFLTWQQMVGAAVLCLLFDILILPHLDTDNEWRDSVAGRTPAVPGATWLYPVSLLALMVIYRDHLNVIAGVWVIMALGDSMAGITGPALRGPALPYNRAKTWPGFGAFLLAGAIGAYLITRWVAPSIPTGRVLNICAATALVGALVESLPIRLDDDISVPLVCGGFMFCAYLVEQSAFDSNLPYLKLRIFLAVAVNLTLALIALPLKLVNRSGAAAGFVLGVVVYMGYGYKSFLLLLAFFGLGSAATRLGYAKKAALGIAERRGGARSWREALANTLTGAFFSILVITTHYERAFLVALVATFAEAAGDTVSSEIGQWLSPRAYLITTLRPVTAGENGGVSLVGSAAALTASALVVVLGFGLGLCGRGGTLIALAGALAGNVLDSMLGATLERRGLITNGIVNFAGTSFAGAVALSLAFHFHLG